MYHLVKVESYAGDSVIRSEYVAEVCRLIGNTLWPRDEQERSADIYKRIDFRTLIPIGTVYWHWTPMGYAFKPNDLPDEVIAAFAEQVLDKLYSIV